MAGVNGNESYYGSGVVIEYKKSYLRFDLSEPGKHLSQEFINDGKIKLVEMDDIFYKVELSSFNRNKIEVESCKDLKDEQLDPPDESLIRELAELFADDKTVNVWLNSNGEPMYISGTGNARLLNMEHYKNADKINLEDLVKKSVDSSFDIARCAIVSEEGTLYYIRDTDTMSKLFIPFMLEWFNERFPELMTDDSDRNSTKISKLGFRMLLQMFIFGAHGYTNTAPITLQANSEFLVSIPEVIESSLGGGIKLKDRQLKQLLDMLPVKAKLASLNKGFFGKHMIVDPTSIEVAFPEHERCTWYTFTTAMEMFPSSCTIYFAPGQVIVDDEDNEIFSAFDVASLMYRGPNFVLPDEQNTISVVVSGDSIETKLRTRMLNYFEKFFDLPISSWRIKGRSAR